MREPSTAVIYNIQHYSDISDKQNQGTVVVKGH